MNCYFTKDKLRLASHDGTIVPVEVDMLLCSQTILDILEEAYLEENCVVYIPAIRGAVLKKCMEFAEYHRGEPEPEVDERGFSVNKSLDLCDWDREFFGGEDQVPMLFDLILAAQYLKMRGLLDASCKMVASMIRGKTPEQIRKVFNIKDDFSDEERKEMSTMKVGKGKPAKK